MPRELDRNPSEPREIESFQFSQELYRRVVEASLQGILIHQDGFIRYANDSLARMFDYDSPNELIGKPVWETFVTRESLADLQARTRRILEGEMLPAHPGWRAVGKSGRTVWVATSASRIEWQGRPAIAAFYLDITEQKTAQLQEHYRRAVLERIASGQSLAAILESIVAYVEEASPASRCSILLLDKSRRHLLHGAAPRLPDSYNQAIHGVEIGSTVGSCGAAAYLKQCVVVEDIETHPNWAPYRELARRAGLRACWSEPILSPSGDVLGTFAIYHDQPQAPSAVEIEVVGLSTHLASIAIERANAEEAVRESQRVLRMVLDNIPQGVFWKDRQSHYLGCNRVVARAFGRATPEEIVGIDDYALAGPKREQADFFVAKDRQVMESNTPELGIIEEATLADGTTIWLETNKLPMRNSAGEVIGILGTWQDITERKRAEAERNRLEAQLQHAQKLESLGVLAGGIAHDFNNLLTSILGYADLALLELPAGSPARPLITQVVNGARQAAELTAQMLAYSGKGRFVVEPISLSAQVEDLTRLLQISISKKCVLKFDLMPNMPAIDADATQMRQIIMNLVINASEATGDNGGVIAVTTGVMHCDHNYLSETYLDDNLREGQYAYLEVADNGCGMSEQTRARIFDPFFTTKFTGRGLGLSAVLGIVRGHQGAIKCYSEPGKGTTFKVLFPISSQPAKSVEPAGGGSKSWRGTGTVLVVDDEDSVRTLARRMLETLGFSVLTAVDGQQAVEVFRKEGERICLVLLDMTMPNLDGEETFRELRRMRGDIRAILSSGYNEQTATSRFAGKGLAGFIQKPYRFEELAAVVRKVCESNAGASTSRPPPDS